MNLNLAETNVFQLNFNLVNGLAIYHIGINLADIYHYINLTTTICSNKVKYINIKCWLKGRIV